MAEVNDCRPGQFTAEDALTLHNPSLFGGWRVVVVRGVHDLPEEVGIGAHVVRAATRCPTWRWS